MLTVPSERRTLPVRLCDVREPVRLAAARRCARREPADAHDVLWAALFPSTRVYYVAASAWPLVRSLAA